MQFEMNGKSYDSFQDFLHDLKTKIEGKCDCPKHKEMRDGSTKSPFKIWASKDKAIKGQLYYKLNIDRNGDLDLVIVNSSDEIISYLISLNKLTKELVLHRGIPSQVEHELNLPLTSKKSLIIA